MPGIVHSCNVILKPRSRPRGGGAQPGSRACACGAQHVYPDQPDCKSPKAKGKLNILLLCLEIKNINKNTIYLKWLSGYRINTNTSQTLKMSDNLSDINSNAVRPKQMSHGKDAILNFQHAQQIHLWCMRKAQDVSIFTLPQNHLC